jgi:very-short-patch-repair endonuclease
MRNRRVTAAVRRRARELRREMTPAEAVLWEALRAGRLQDLHFRRQHPVGPFILDFYCSAARLCVEVDGSVHDGREEMDRMRSEGLGTLGIRVLRFRNAEVLENLPGVLARISTAALPYRILPPSPA